MVSNWSSLTVLSQQVVQLTKGGREAATGWGAPHRPRPHAPLHGHPNARLTERGRLRLVIQHL